MRKKINQMFIWLKASIIYIGYLNSIRHHAKKGAQLDHQLVRRKNCQILSAIKEGQQKYCETVYSRSGINHMWILKNSKDLFDNLKSRSFSQVSSIKTFDFSTLYTTLPHDKLKTRLKETIHKTVSHRNYGSNFVVLGYNSTYFSNKIHKGKTCYSEE